MTDKKPHECHECGAEFYVFSTYDEQDADDVSFCPYCGSELYHLDEDSEPDCDLDYDD